MRNLLEKSNRIDIPNTWIWEDDENLIDSTDILVPIISGEENGLTTKEGTELL